jgi:hypothetical protein
MAQNQFKHGVDHLSGGTRSPLGAGLNDNGLWLQRSPFQQFDLDTESMFLQHNVSENAIRNDFGFGSPNNVARVHPFGHLILAILGPSKSSDILNND